MGKWYGPQGTWSSALRMLSVCISDRRPVMVFSLIVAGPLRSVTGSAKEV